MRHKELSAQELQDRIREVDREIGAVGESAVADYMLDQGWIRLRTPQFSRAMMAVGVQETAGQSPEKFIDRAFWRHHEDGTEEWELIQVKTTCVHTDSVSRLSVFLPRHVQERYITYTKAIIDEIDNNELTPFPDLVKVNLYIANRKGVFRIDIMDMTKHSIRNGKSPILHVDREWCEPVRNWTDEERVEYESLCDEKRRYDRLRKKHLENPHQLPLRLGGGM